MPKKITKTGVDRRVEEEEANLKVFAFYVKVEPEPEAQHWTLSVSAMVGLFMCLTLLVAGLLFVFSEAGSPLIVELGDFRVTYQHFGVGILGLAAYLLVKLVGSLKK